MANRLFPGDIVLDDSKFLRLGFDLEAVPTLDANDVDRFASAARFSASDREAGVARALAILREDPDLAAQFLLATSGNGQVLWAGPAGSAQLESRSSGVRIWRKRTGDEYSGDNLFGRFLTDVRDALRRDLSDYLVEERPVGEHQVVVDFTRKGAYQSNIDEAEAAGKQFIHVDRYVPARFRFDASLDGTTGHAQRASDEEVPFHRFECPFGTAYPSPIIVESVAEASYLYERALRGELDWNALFDSLESRGLLDKNMTPRRRKNLVSDFTAQFSWMREQIVSNPALRERPVVAQSLLSPDASLGRSVFDADLAPSPAHVLARYINNPILLYVPAENGVVHSLSLQDKEETELFRLQESAKESVGLLVVGSDVIGGREPGRKATQTVTRKETSDSEGNKVILREKKFDIPMKTREEIEADYAAFSKRMDEVLSGIPDGTSVRLVSGNSSSLSDSIGVGTPRMLERYVREHGGRVSEWNYTLGRADERARDGHEVKNEKLELVLMSHFGEAYPVLCGNAPAVAFQVNPNDPDSEVYFDGRSGLAGDGVVCFSMDEDKNNRNILALGSLAAMEGLPVIHVQENMPVEDQRKALLAGTALSRSALSGEVFETGMLFVGEQRGDWPIAECNMLSFIDSETHFSVPFVVDRFPSPVLVSGHPFNSAMSAYVALVADACGLADRQMLSGIAKAEGSLTELSNKLEEILGGKALEPAVEEKLLRQATRLMLSSNSAFAERLLELNERDIVMPINRKDDSGLFVDLDGKGLNRFGMVLTEERRQMVEEREARRQAAVEENRKVLEEANRRQKLSVGARADGQKVAGGLPASAEAARDAVWFIGTNSPDQLAIKGEEHSFEMWNDMDGEDPLVREKAARPWVDDGEGGRLDNNFVYLFPSDLATVTGRRRPSMRADSRDLTGLTRVDPKTGKEFVCAYGIPVRLNNKGNEIINPENAPCSYRLDNDAANYAESLVLADSLARATAIRHSMSLILPGRERKDGSSYYTLGQVFMENSWDRKEKKWIRNPHASSLNETLTDRYIKLLEQGKTYPLNCVPLPSSLYKEELPDGTDTAGRHVSAEGRFLSDLNLALRIANSTAVALGVPLRFPLDEKGRIDLGPGVPEEFRALAERKIDAFIGVVKEEDIIDGPLPLIERISMWEAAKHRDAMTKAGDRYMRPNDLVYPFGQYDFSMILAGQTAPLHEMAFRMDDAVFTLVDAKLTRSLSSGEINKYLSYSKNDERRFVVRTTDVEKLPKFFAALSAYCERAKAVKVDARLVRDTEKAAEGESLDGFVRLLSSNSLDFAETEHDIGREATVFNAQGSVLQDVSRDCEGKITKITDAGTSSRNIDGEDISGVYWGHADANDGFMGYAQVRYLLPDGKQSDWFTVKDLDLAKDMVMSMVRRSYRTDSQALPDSSVLDMLMVSEAVRFAGEDFRTMAFESKKQSVVDDKVVSVEAAPVPEVEKGAEETVAQQSEAQEEPVIVFSESAGGYQQRTRENAQAVDVDFTFAFGVDFSTYGERATAKAAGDSIIQVELPLKKSGGIDLSAKAVKTAVDALADALPEEFLSGEPFGVNIAGNGLQTLTPVGATQEQCDEFVTRVLGSLVKMGAEIQSLRSGGQSGVDEAGAVAGVVLGIPTEVHAPKGWVMRGPDGKDIYDEKAFKARFESSVKDYKRLSADCKVQKKQHSKQSL